MGIVIRRNAFADEASAIGLVESLGYTAYPGDREATELDLHWHDFDQAVAIVHGRYELTDGEGGDTFVLESGTLFELTDRVVHADRHGPYRVVFGFRADPRTFEAPISRDPVDRELP